MNNKPEHDASVFTNALDTENYHHEDKSTSCPNPPKFLHYTEDFYPSDDGAFGRHPTHMPVANQNPYSAAPGFNAPARTAPVKKNKKNKKNTPMMIAVIAAVVIVLAVAGFFAYKFFFNGNNDSTEAATPSKTATPDSAPTQKITENKIAKMITVPDVTGQSEEDARRMLNAAGITNIDIKRMFSEDYAPSYVISQTPEPNTEISSEEKVRLYISKEDSNASVFGTTEAVEDYDGYIFPESNRRNLTEEDVAPLTGDEDTLQLAYDEIYARHGAIFSTPEETEYFNSKSWYNGTVSKREIDTAGFNQFELYNISFLRKYLDN